MDSNGLRFWMLSSRQDWFPAGPVDASSGLSFCESRRRVQLQSLAAPDKSTEDPATALGAVERVPAARDPFGTYARWDPSSGHVVAGGAGNEEIPIYSPPPLTPVTDLALGQDGVLYVAVAGHLVFVDLRERWPIYTLVAPNVTFWRLAAHPEGGVIALDRAGGQLVRVRGQPPRADEVQPAAAPGIFRPIVPDLDLPRVDAVATLPAGEAFVAIADRGDGRFALLSWASKDPTNTKAFVRVFDDIALVGPAVTLVGCAFPYSMAWLGVERIALMRTGSSTLALVYDLAPEATSLAPSGDTYVFAAADPPPFAHRGAPLPEPPYSGIGADLAPLVRLSLQSFKVTDTIRGVRRVDAGAALATWHRVFVEAVIPPGCGVVVSLAAADDPAALDAPDVVFHPHLFGDAPIPAGAPDAPRGVWLRTPSEVAFHPGLLGEAPVPGRSGLFMALVQRAGRAVRALQGRHLAVKLTLVGDGRATPEVAAVRVYGPRYSYVEHYLPEIYRESRFGASADAVGPSTGPDFLERFVDIFEAELTRIEDRVASAYLLTRPDSTPDDALGWLGSWLGIAPDGDPPDRFRARLRAAPALFREHGTLTGLSDAIDIATGGLCSRGAVVLVEDYRLRHTFATILGADLSLRDDALLPGVSPSSNSYVGPALFLGDEHNTEFLALFASDVATLAEQPSVEAFYEALAHRVTVFVHDQVEMVDLQLIARVLEREKPAHVAATVRRATQPFLVGLASLLGTDTYLAPAPPPQETRLGQSLLGRWTFVREVPALDPRLAGARGVAPLGKPVARITGTKVILAGQPITLDGSGSTVPDGGTITHFHWTLLSTT
jgi:phage tail-like protein